MRWLNFDVSHIRFGVSSDRTRPAIRKFNLVSTCFRTFLTKMFGYLLPMFGFSRKLSKDDPQSNKGWALTSEHQAKLQQDSTDPAVPVAPITCAICLVEINPVYYSLRLSCPTPLSTSPHFIDLSCLKQAFLLATVDRILMPARCQCSLEIPFHVVSHLLTTSQSKEYRKKQEEWSKEDLGELGKKGGWENSANDEEREMIEGLMESKLGRKRLRKCPGCCRIVEKNDGCRHMTCVCRAEWCFTCAQEFAAGYICGCNK